jgi:hypothetical protein
MTDRLNLPVPIAQVDLPQEFGGISVATLGWLKHHPENPAMQQVDTTCAKCGKPIRATAIFAKVTACDDCCAKYRTDERDAKFRDYWRRMIPLAIECRDSIWVSHRQGGRQGGVSMPL